MNKLDILKNFVDDRGQLLPIEFSKIPFEVKRVFIVSDVPKNCLRGDHAHHKTKQYLLCLKGKVEVILNDGINEERIILNESEGLLINEMIWDSQRFIDENTILVVLCSSEYDINDYILNFEEFLQIVK